MKTLAGIVAIVVVLVVGMPAQARVFELGQPVVAQVTLPDAWKPKKIRAGAEATSADDEIYVAIEVASVAKVEEAMKEAFAYLISEGVKIDPATQKQQQGKVNDMDVIDLSFSGKDKDGDDTKVSVSAIIVSPSIVLILTYWGSENGEKLHGKTLDGILQSIKKAG